MNKVAIIVDSNSGITQAEGTELGIYVVPMPFNIGMETFYEDISLTRPDFFKYMADGADISTSQPTPGDIMRLWDKLLKVYEELVYIPMSSGLSGSCQTAMLLATEDDYDGKVFVVDNQRISITQKQAAIEAKKMARDGKRGAEIAQHLLDTKLDASIYIMVDTLLYLKKGGRITPAAAALGTILKLKPVLQIQGKKLDAFAKARTLKQGKSIMIEALKKDLETRFGGEKDPSKIRVAIAHTENDDAAEIFRQEILEEFPGFDIEIQPLALSIATHTGPGALACGMVRIAY